MRILGMIRVITVVCTGLLAGIFQGLLMSAPARDALSASSFVQHQQIVHAHHVRLALPLILVAMVTGLTWLLLVRSRSRRAEFWLIAASLVGIVSIAIVSQAVNAPLNDQLMTWSISTPPANLRELWTPWEDAHILRTAVANVAFVFADVCNSVSHQPFCPRNLIARHATNISHAQ
jgi:uncharacterized membrane protein